MRLPDFLLANTGAILAEWDAFARSVWPATGPSADDVRDHAEALLRAIAADMKTPQTAPEQSDKSKGLREAHALGGDLITASSDHAVGRAGSGFELRAVMAEYRALRASVVRLWFESNPSPDSHDLADLTRFHEAMDQSLAEAVHRYSEHLDKTRQLLVRILKHDLRTPLNAIALVAQGLPETREGDREVSDAAAQIASSANAISQLLNNFLDFAVTRLGSRVPIAPAPMDLAALCREVVSEVRADSAPCEWRVETEGELRGEWDRTRLRQVLSNLVGNAVQHGDRTSPITVSATSEGSCARLSVHNHGPHIPEELQPRIFEPFVSGSHGETRPGSVGLGLYIARQVVAAHRGWIEVRSTASEGTTFTVTLPRTAAR